MAYKETKIKVKGSAKVYGHRSHSNGDRMMRTLIKGGFFDQDLNKRYGIQRKHN